MPLHAQLNIIHISTNLSIRLPGVVYIDTEGTFDAVRLSQIACSRFPGRFATGSGGSAAAAVRHAALLQALGRVTVFRESTMADVVARLASLEDLMAVTRVRLVVLDSVAAPARREFDHRDQGAMASRSDMLARQASLLKALAEAFRVPVIVTNQVTTVVNSNRDGAAVTAVDEELLPALGTTWAHCVSNRFLLADGSGDKGGDGRGDRGHGCGVLVVLKSPCAPNVKLRFVIEAAGMCEGGTAT